MVALFSRIGASQFGGKARLLACETRWPPSANESWRVRPTPRYRTNSRYDTLLVCVTPLCTEVPKSREMLLARRSETQRHLFKSCGGFVTSRSDVRLCLAWYK